MPDFKGDFIDQMQFDTGRQLGRQQGAALGNAAAIQDQIDATQSRIDAITSSPTGAPHSLRSAIITALVFVFTDQAGAGQFASGKDFAGYTLSGLRGQVAGLQQVQQQVQAQTGTLGAFLNGAGGFNAGMAPVFDPDGSGFSK